MNVDGEQQNYLYEPLNPHRREIRVLELRTPESNGVVNCRLRIVSLDDLTVDFAAHIAEREQSFPSLTDEWAKSCFEACQIEHETCDGIPISWERALPQGHAWLDQSIELRVADPSLAETLQCTPAPPLPLRDDQRPRTVCFRPRFQWGDFEALSYCWENGSRDTPILLDGDEFWVPHNLDAVLRRLYHIPEFHDGMFLWCDAICIDQDNLRERNHQVGLMQDIYSTAFAVISWLGAETSDSVVGLHHMKCLEYIAQRSGLSFKAGSRYLSQLTKFQTEGLEELILGLRWDPIIRLLSREYWHRLWIIQELMLNPHLSLFLCGGMQVSRAVISQTSRICLELANYISTSSRPQEAAPFTQMQIYGEATHVFNLLRGTEDVSVILDLAQKGHCSDARDKVYGLLGLMPRDLARHLRPDYSISWQQLYVKFADALLAYEGITGVLAWSAVVEGQLLPSWTPDLRSEFPRHRVRWLKLRSAGGDPATARAHIAHDSKSLECTAILLGSIDKLSTSEGEANGHASRDAETTPLESSGEFDHRAKASERAILHTTLTMDPPANIDYPNMSIQEREELKNTIWSVPWNPSHSSIPQEVLRSPYWPRFESFRRSNSTFKVGRYSLRELFETDGGGGESRWTDLATRHIAIVVLALQGRRLAVVGDGCGGPAMVPERARSGDTVAVLLGCNFPVVLRKTESSIRGRCAYSYVGECFYHGYMDGEAVVAAEKRGLERSDIVLF